MVPQTGEAAKDFLTRRSLALSRTACLIAAILPLLATIGWVFHIEFFVRVYPSLPVMQPETAFGLVLSAVAILFTGDNRRSERGAGIVSTLGFMITLLGIFILAEYILGWNPGIDRLLIPKTAETLQYPGRPSPQTAANFALLGLGILIYNLPRLPVHPGQILALCTAGNAIVALTGYIFSTDEFYGFPLFESDIGMAVHTAAAFILLAAALLCSRPNEGLMTLVTSDTRSGHIARRILLAATLTPPVIGALTSFGVFKQWYDVRVQVSLFVVLLVGLVLRATWQTVRQAEQDELLARASLEQARTANENLKRAMDERRVFEALIENSSDFIGIADPNSKPVYLNPAGRRMVGLAGDYPVKNTEILEYYTPDQRAFASDVILRSMVERGHWQGETYFRNWKTQERIPVSDEHFTIRDPETGRVLGMGTVSRDISDARLVQEQLRQSEERFQLALQGADLAAWDWNIATGEVIFSPRWAEMRGFQPEEIQPHVNFWRSGIHPDDWPRVDKALTDYFHGVTSRYEIEFRAQTKSGQWIWILDRGKLFTRDERGQPLRMVGTELDISDRKRLEQELLQAVKTREEVLAIVSHDLRNPVASMSLVAHLLHQLQQIDAGKLHDFADKIQRAADRMLLLISNLLDFSKIQSGSFSVNLLAGRLSEPVLPVIDSVRMLAEARQQTLEVDLPPDLPDVLLDGYRIGQVISNLLGNAIKFTPEKGVIRIFARRSGDTVVVSVSDTGPGIPPEYLGKVFDRYWQAEGPKSAGSGLGLAIAKGIVEAHHGTIWAESRSGHGSCFSFTLPVANVDTIRSDHAA